MLHITCSFCSLNPIQHFVKNNLVQMSIGAQFKFTCFTSWRGKFFFFKKKGQWKNNTCMEVQSNSINFHCSITGVITWTLHEALDIWKVGFKWYTCTSIGQEAPGLGVSVVLNNNKMLISEILEMHYHSQ